MKLNLLLVDDHEGVRRDIMEYFESAGHRVVGAINGVGAWSLLVSGGEKFDAVISDLEMSGMDGLELLRRMRADERTRDTTFALMTTQAAATGGNEALEALCTQLNATLWVKGQVDFLYDLEAYLLKSKEEGGTI